MGVRVLFAALVLGLANGIAWFPVWSASGDHMLVLLAFVTVQPLAFILERLLPTLAIIGVLGAYLIESGRQDAARGRRQWWDGERVAIIIAALAAAALLESIVFPISPSLNLLPAYAAANTALAVAVSLYLFWTANRMTGSPTKAVRMVAVGLACASAALGFSLTSSLGMLPLGGQNVIPWMDIARWLLGEASLALWVAVYAGILLRGRTSPTPISVVGA